MTGGINSELWVVSSGRCESCRAEGLRLQPDHFRQTVEGETAKDSSRHATFAGVFCQNFGGALPGKCSTEILF
jgi:hypothetical protein